jgi:hypothetical protein
LFRIASATFTRNSDVSPSCPYTFCQEIANLCLFRMIDHPFADRPAVRFGQLVFARQCSYEKGSYA